MSDNTELKRAAEAVKQSFAALCENGGDELAEAWDSAELAYDDVANPDAVLALIAENERLKAGVDSDMAEIDRIQAEYDKQFRMARGFRVERDKLRAESEQLAKTADCWDRLNVQNKALSDSFRAERDQLKAENKRQADQFKQWQASHHENYVNAAEERDELRFENERLESEAVYSAAGFDAAREEIARLKAESEIFEEGMRSLASTLGAGGYNAEKLTATQLVEKVQWGVDHLADMSGRLVDQLRAEVAGLRTGYEAYEQVNAELKAESQRLRQIVSDSATSCGAAVSVECSLDFMAHLPVEIFSVISKLRNALAECANSLQGEMLQKFGGQLPEDMHPVTRREYDRDIAEVSGYRAALGQGEQS